MSKSESITSQLSDLNENSWLNFHLALIELRVNKGLTQAEVAERLDVSQPAVSQFEKLTSYPKVETMLSYALAIGARVTFTVENFDQ